MLKNQESSVIGVIGRDREKKRFSQILASKEAELIAVYGRRRVGKTYLIEEYVASKCDLVFSVKGIKDASLKEQLHHFKKELESVFYNDLPLPDLNSWMEALEALAKALEATLKKKSLKNILLFFDELPWMAVPKSSLVQAIDHYWNTKFSKISGLKWVVCGSAASWILDNLIHAKGGLHNRITQIFRIEPFTLAETKEYLTYRRIHFKEKQLIEIYMALGGIPHYLRLLQPGLSVYQNIANLCFENEGYLREEFDRLFSSLFNDSEIHTRIVEVLGEHPNGLELEVLSKASKISMGGRLVKYLQQLEQAGFIARLTPYQHKTKSTLYRLIDEYTLFYLKWIRSSPQGVFAKGALEYWQSKFHSPSYAAWCGYAFESICLKHIDKIISGLEIQSLVLHAGIWKHVPRKGQKAEKGAQIDMLFDRSDGAITVCEIKYSDKEFILDKAYAKELQTKLEVFADQTKTKKTIFLALITPYGLKKNIWSEDLITSVVTAESLLET